MVATHRLTAGSIFAERYRVERLLGQGAMGAVYLVRDEIAGVWLALKVLKPEVASEPKALARFERETHVGRRIGDPHVVEVLAAGFDSSTGLPWLAMEYLQGQPLSEYLGRPGVTSTERRSLLGQLCETLVAAHRAGVIHRDLKPENIMVLDGAAGPFVKVLDFGIAKLFAPSLIASITEAGLGTPMWTAPEQGKPDAVLGPSVDVWALGLLAFYVLSGRIYWRHMNDERSSAVDLAVEILREPIAVPSERAAQLGCTEPLPSGFDQWFARCVVREPQARFAHADEAYAGLMPLLYPVAQPAPPHGVAPPAPPLGRAPAARSRAAWPGVALAVALATVLCGAVLVAWLLLR